MSIKPKIREILTRHDIREYSISEIWQDQIIRVKTYPMPTVGFASEMLKSIPKDWKLHLGILSKEQRSLADGAEGNHEDACDHEGWVIRGRCERCGSRGLESDQEIYEWENPR